MAAEDAFVLVREVLDDTSDEGPADALFAIETLSHGVRSSIRFPANGSSDEQSVHIRRRIWKSARAELAQNASARIAVSDRILNEPVLECFFAELLPPRHTL